MGFWRRAKTLSGTNKKMFIDNLTKDLCMFAMLGLKKLLRSPEASTIIMASSLLGQAFWNKKVTSWTARRATQVLWGFLVWLFHAPVLWFWVRIFIVTSCCMSCPDFLTMMNCTPSTRNKNMMSKQLWSQGSLYLSACFRENSPTGYAERRGRILVVAELRHSGRALRVLGKRRETDAKAISKSAGGKWGVYEL